MLLQAAWSTAQLKKLDTLTSAVLVSSPNQVSPATCTDCQSCKHSTSAALLVSNVILFGQG
jgi:hypothetical protein